MTSPSTPPRTRLPIRYPYSWCPMFRDSTPQTSPRSQDQRVKLVPCRQIYHQSIHIWRRSWKCDLRLSNFCGETGDDSTPRLKSSSFKEDISASLLLLVRIISAAVSLESVVLAEFWLMPLQPQSQSREWDSMGASHRRESEKRRNSRCIGAEPLSIWYKDPRLSKVGPGTDELQRKTWCSSL